MAQAARLALLLISLAVLGRLLSPADFGVFAFALAIVGVAELLRDFGLSASAVSAPQLSSARKSNLFWMNVALGLTLSIIITIAGLLMLALNANAAVASAMIGLSVVYLLNGVQTQFQVELTRSFRFTAIATTDILSQFLGLVVGISAALLGAGYWSLVVMQIVVSVTLLVGRATIAGIDVHAATLQRCIRITFVRMDVGFRERFRTSPGVVGGDTAVPSPALTPSASLAGLPKSSTSQ